MSDATLEKLRSDIGASGYAVLVKRRYWFGWKRAEVFLILKGVMTQQALDIAKADGKLVEALTPDTNWGEVVA